MSHANAATVKPILAYHVNLFIPAHRAEVPPGSSDEVQFDPNAPPRGCRASLRPTRRRGTRDDRFRKPRFGLLAHPRMAVSLCLDVRLLEDLAYQIGLFSLPAQVDHQLSDKSDRDELHAEYHAQHGQREQERRVLDEHAE